MKKIAYGFSGFGAQTFHFVVLWYCKEKECRIGMVVLGFIFSSMKMWFTGGKLRGKNVCVCLS